MTLPEALQRANAHWQAGQTASAQQLCQRILAQIPGQPDALHLMGLMAHAYGDTDRAITLLVQATAHPDAAPVYFSNLAEFYRLRGRLREGEAAARSALARAPNLAGAWNNLGILLQEMGRYDESRDCLERVRAVNPANPQVLNNLANTCLRHGDIAQAEMYWREAIARDPSYAQPHSNLAKMFTDRGDYDQAREYGRRAITLNPHLADAYINLAAVEQESGQPAAAAIRWLQALLAFAPQHAGGLATRALLQVEQEQLDAALADAQQAVALAPESADAHYALGRVRQAQGEVEAALAAFTQAVELPGTKAEDAAIAAAVLHMEEGQKDSADAAFRAVVARFPRSASAWYNWADLHRFSATDPEIDQMEALLADSLLPREQMRLHFALGKAWLDAKDAERAFAHFHAGNAQKRATFDYDPVQTSAWVDAILRTLTTERYQTLAGQGQRVADNAPGHPIFVVGLPRSGTTLVERILATHSRVQAGGELSALQQILGDQSYPEALNQVTPETLQGWGAAYLAKTTPLVGDAPYLVDKMPANFFYAGLIPLLLPQAKVIWCRRDPVDTGLSCYSKLFSGEQRFSYRLDEIGHFVKDAQRLLAHWQAILPEDRFLVLDYEALVADFDTQARRLLDFIGLDWEDGIAEFHRQPGRVRTASVNQVREPLYARAVGRWRPYATHLQPLLDVLGMKSDPSHTSVP